MAGTAGPILVARAVDVIRQRPTWETMLLMAGGVLLMGVSAWIFNYVRRIISAQVIGDVVLKLREDVFDATVGHDLSFYDEHASGKIVSRVTSDTQDFSNVVTLVLDLLSQLLLVLLLSIWLFNISARLTLLLLGMAPLAVVTALSFRKIARRVTRRAPRDRQDQRADPGIDQRHRRRQELPAGARHLRTFSANNQQAYRVGVRRGLVINTIFPLMGMMSGLSIGALFYVSGLATRGASGLSPGNWYLFMQAVGFYWWPLMSIASFWSQFQDGLSAAERVFALIDAEPKVAQTADEPIDALQGEIEFRHLRFSYTDGEVVLPDFSLHIAPARP